jgi:hypothetical protein
VAYIAPVTKERKIDIEVILLGVSLMNLKNERTGPVIQYQNSIRNIPMKLYSSLERVSSDSSRLCQVRAK